MKELILIQNGKDYQFSEEKELIAYLLGNSFYLISKEQQINQMLINALINCKNTNLKVKKIEEKTDAKIDIRNKFIVYDEKTYILSLLLTNRITLLEKTEANIFTKTLNKENINDNYIIVNKFAEELLENYINN